MRISVVYTNRNRYLSPAPLGAMLVASRLRQDGHEVDFVDLMHEGDPETALARAIESGRPDLVCMSVRNVDNMQMDSLDRPLELISAYSGIVRERTRAPILIGGTAVTTFPVQIRRKLGADYAFAGDDTVNVSRFVSSLARGAPDLGTPGLVWEDSAGVHRNPFSIRGYADTRFTGWEWLDLKKYRKGYYDCGVVTCTGCPHGCSFCDAHRTFGREYVPRDPTVVVEELRELEEKHHARSVFLVNNGLNYPLESGKEFLARLAEARLKMSFACILEPGPLDGEFARLLFRANCNMAMVFGSTLDDSVLERNQPHYRSADVIRIAKLLGQADVPYIMGLMFGGMGESLEGVKRTLDITLTLKPAMLVTGVGFRIQPETPLREAAIKEGVISPSDDGFEPRFYTPRDAPAEEIRKILKAFGRAHPLNRLRMVSFMARSIKEGIFGRPGRS
jgi:radical SAM superfamily enzyme YgiQ (UPF0313 family)